jgi:hypothetical protein
MKWFSVDLHSAVRLESKAALTSHAESKVSDYVLFFVRLVLNIAIISACSENVICECEKVDRCHFCDEIGCGCENKLSYPRCELIFASESFVFLICNFQVELCGQLQRLRRRPCCPKSKRVQRGRLVSTLNRLLGRRLVPRRLFSRRLRRAWTALCTIHQSRASSGTKKLFALSEQWAT